jgi:hypothetical protein
MNTYERHRLYRLRRHRARLMRRRVLAITGVAAASLAAWSMLAHWTPEAVAPPAPAELGAQAARDIMIAAARSVNSVDRQLRSGAREEAKSVARALFHREPGALRSVRNTASGTHAEVYGGTGSNSYTAENNRADAFFVLPPLDSGAFMPAARAAESTRDSGTAHVLDILLIGLDSRLGDAGGRADAIHLLTIDLDAPHIRITSIPRGTWSDLGRENESSNIIANVRALRGREELQRRVARLCGRDSVPYYIEIGFSDAFGILELLGYADPSAELQALRHRRDYQYGDHTRCYNQGLFVRSAILRMLPLLDGAAGDLLLHAGRDFVRSNLRMDQCRGMVYLLNDAGVASRPTCVTVHLRSRFRQQVARAELPLTYVHAVRGIDFNEFGGSSGTAERRIRAALREAAEATRPERMHEALHTLFHQHAWLQLSARPLRRLLRDSLALQLLAACAQLGDTAEIARIRRTLRADDVLFQQGNGSPESSARLLEGR